LLPNNSAHLATNSYSLVLTIKSAFMQSIRAAIFSTKCFSHQTTFFLANKPAICLSNEPALKSTIYPADCKTDKPAFKFSVKRAYYTANNATKYSAQFEPV
jgi:hypothetical protein